MALPYCVYVLFSEKDHLLYIGFTTNLENRLNRHNTGGNKSTAPRIPFQLIFCEYYLFKDDALKREEYFKTSAGKRTLKLMLATTFEKLGYKMPEQVISIEETEE